MLGRATLDPTYELEIAVMSAEQGATHVAANDEVEFKGLDGVDALVNNEALEILRGWINVPEMVELLKQAGFAEAGDAERKEAA
jgi:hypothetical protein